MPLPTPEAGLVIRYEFLWHNEHEAGEEDGKKKRPCAIIVASKIDQGRTSVIVAPITHTKPDDGRGVELPMRVRQSLGLDDLPSWVIIDELNQFMWPGYHIHPIDNSLPAKFEFGFLPPKLFEEVRDKIANLDKEKKKTVNRDEVA
ncbi:mRNA-degrading endonuclease toxin of MazEF toxin-antitoxin module [Nitrobacteraceae bacterium AZCC 2146]